MFTHCHGVTLKLTTYCYYKYQYIVKKTMKKARVCYNINKSAYHIVEHDTLQASNKYYRGGICTVGLSPLRFGIIGSLNHRIIIVVAID